MRTILINRTITVIANEGLDKTTTKAIVSGTGINEVYIYRNFIDKEDLLAKTFDRLDDELVDKTLDTIRVMNLTEFDFDVRAKMYFMEIWRFLLSNREKCLAFIRYYYSPYFRKYSETSHKLRFKPFLEKFQLLFREEANTWLILNYILNVMLDFAVKVFNEEAQDDDDTSEHIFRVLYASVKQYFKNNGEN